MKTESDTWCVDNMAAPKEGTVTHSSKKLDMKLRKLEKILSSKEHLEISSQPTQILCIQNGGLGNNVSQLELLSVFSASGDVSDVVMIPQKQYSFVSFTDVAGASRAFHHFNGHLLRKGNDPSQDVVLYLLFVKRAPSPLKPSSERPPGLHVLEDFVTEEDEEKLLSLVNMDDTEEIKVGGVMKHRQVKHFGFEFRYDINDVDVNNPLPDGIPPLCQNILHRAYNLGVIGHMPDQLTVNQYKPGQGIPPHVDTVDAFEDGIVSLSLGSQTMMDFRHPDGRHLLVTLPRRSLLVMTGESRYIWSHGITPRKSDIVLTPDRDGLTLQNRDVRTSFTFRKVILNRKQTNARQKADAGLKSVPQSDSEGRELEQQHVHQVSCSLCMTALPNTSAALATKPWPRVAEFLLDLPDGFLVADVGCGNGKYLGINKKIFEIGSDYSSNLASICRSRGFETCVADVTNLPLRCGVLDVVLCIAVIHHMSTQARRLRAVSEIIRVLRSGGKALIYVWAMEQDYDKTPSKYINTGRQKKPEQMLKDSRETVGEPTSSGTKLQSAELGRKDGLEMNQLTQKQNAHLRVSPADISSTAQQLNIRRKPAEVLEMSVASNDTGVSVHGVHSQSETSVLPDTSKTLHVHVNRTQFKEQDMLVPWQLQCKMANEDKSEACAENGDKSSVFHRFYHVFRQGELEALCKKVPGCEVRTRYYDQGNWCVVVEKL
ncbi:unnamed protein product [Candidula unifasciata]|uniref:tRNA (carboxymethyluridine(34)-5-O)-methyltransferase n=1 Tax=Candidula unifasciata TaxID=100452 RepID=A0A8S3ZNN8_9EUPU|nr:unnamed protein product [Candidula unifasciata]